MTTDGFGMQAGLWDMMDAIGPARLVGIAAKVAGHEADRAAIELMNTDLAKRWAAAEYILRAAVKELAALNLGPG